MIYYDLLPPRAICRRVSEGQYVVGSVVKGGAFCQGDNMSCSQEKSKKRARTRFALNSQKMKGRRDIRKMDLT